MENRIIKYHKGIGKEQKLMSMSFIGIAGIAGVVIIVIVVGLVLALSNR